MPKLVVFRNRKRIEEVAQDIEPRYARRLADQIATSFYEACRIGNLDAARVVSQFEIAMRSRFKERGFSNG